MYQRMRSEALSLATGAAAPVAALAAVSRRPWRAGAGRERRTVVVCPAGNGADCRASGAALLAALASIAATAHDPCLLTIAPGVYDLGTLPLRMCAYVDIEGAGETATRLIANIGVSNSGTVVGADDAELRRLTIENTGGGAFAVAIFNDGVAPRLSRLTAEASGGLASYGVYNCNGAAPAMSHVRALAAGRRCTIGIYNDGAAPIMTHVSATAAGGYVSYGIYNRDGAAPVMTHVRATAGCGDRTFGIYNEQDTWPTMIDVTARALGGIDNIDVYND
ncbi:MAG: hypothetical protein ACJ8CR_21620 [Roseiflexaceae bacterium]